MNYATNKQPLSCRFTRMLGLNVITKALAWVKHQQVSLLIVLITLLSFTSNAEPAKDFTITTIDTRTFTLSSYEQHKPVYLFFWATWCPICKKEIPKVKALYEAYGDQIEILAINVGLNDSLSNVEDYIKEYDIQYPIAFDTNSVISEQFGVFGTPTQVVIDIDGEIRYQGHQYPMGLEGFIGQLSKSKHSKAN